MVIGGTGLIGSRVVDRLNQRGERAQAASPRLGVDAFTGDGLHEALEGSQVVIDVSNPRSFADDAVLEFFSNSTRNVLDAELSTGVEHHIALSVVGTERLQESGYFRAKLAQESLIKESSISFSIVRATQFFEFIGTMADLATEGSTVRLPPVLFQPMGARDVAESVIDISLGEPIHGIVEIAGPEQFRLDQIVQLLLAARNDPRDVSPEPMARYFGARLKERTLLPGKDARLGHTRFEDWLDSQQI